MFLISLLLMLCVINKSLVNYGQARTESKELFLPQPSKYGLFGKSWQEDTFYGNPHKKEVPFNIALNVSRKKRKDKFLHHRSKRYPRFEISLNGSKSRKPMHGFNNAEEKDTLEDNESSETHYQSSKSQTDRPSQIRNRGHDNHSKKSQKKVVTEKSVKFLCSSIRDPCAISSTVPTKHKITLPTFSVVTEFYDEEPEFQAAMAMTKLRCIVTQKPCPTDIFVINAPCRIGHIPVAVVTDDKSTNITLSLQKNSNPVRSKSSSKNHKSDPGRILNIDEVSNVDKMSLTELYKQHFQSAARNLTNDEDMNLSFNNTGRNSLFKNHDNSLLLMKKKNGNISALNTRKMSNNLDLYRNINSEQQPEYSRHFSSNGNKKSLFKLNEDDDKDNPYFKLQLYHNLLNPRVQDRFLYYGETIPLNIRADNERLNLTQIQEQINKKLIERLIKSLNN